MMIVFLMVTLSATLAWSIKAKNPLKVSIGVLSSATLMFTMMAFSAGSTWFSMIFLLLFLGGIIMMFMILSSILPNEKSMKTKTLPIILLTTFLMGFQTPMEDSVTTVSSPTHSFLTSSSNFFFVMALVLLYFLNSLSLLSTESLPMRALFCCRTSAL